MEFKKPNGKMGLVATATLLGAMAISCADLPKTNEPRFLGEPYLIDEYENLDDATRKETEFKADSIIKKYNSRFAEDCTPYSDGRNQKRNKNIDCVTFK